MKELEAFELLYRFLVEEINTLRHKDINEDYFYNKKYGVTMTDKKTGKKYIVADITDALKALEIIKEKVLPFCDSLEPFEYLTQEEYNLLKKVLK